jgi:hypothetical protein
LASVPVEGYDRLAFGTVPAPPHAGIPRSADPDATEPPQESVQEPTMTEAEIVNPSRRNRMNRSTTKIFQAVSLALLLPLAMACGSDDSQQTEEETAAAEQQPATGQQPGQQTDIEVSEEEMETFVEVQMQLADVREEVQGEMQAAEGQEEAQALADEANEEMAGLIEDAGMDIERYDQVASAIQADPELQQRFLEVRNRLTQEELTEGGEQ